MWKQRIQADENVPLILTATQRKLVLEHVMCLSGECEQIIQGTPSGKPMMMTLENLDVFGGCIVADANHCENKKKVKKLDAVF